MEMRTQSFELKAFETYISTNTLFVERLFGIVLVVMLALAACLGMYFHSLKSEIVAMQEALQEVKASFVLEEDQKQPLKDPAAGKSKIVPLIKPFELTNNPILSEKLNDPTPKTKEQEIQTIRRVFGLRKVYSVGIGEQGGISDAIVGKIGNTMNAPIDTITALPQDLKGTLAPVSTVTESPISKHIEKPLYTKEMIDAKIEGTIKAHILVDTDGNVKAVKILNDLGFGTMESARQAFMKWIFLPAKKGNESVAVWITCSIKFILLQ